MVLVEIEACSFYEVAGIDGVDHGFDENFFDGRRSSCQFYVLVDFFHEFRSLFERIVRGPDILLVVLGCRNLQFEWLRTARRVVSSMSF